VQLTFIGAAQVVIGLLLLLMGSSRAMLAFVLACGLMGGSAAMLLPALGGSSIPPIQFALPFLVARLILPGSGTRTLLPGALRANQFYIAYVAYSVAAATLAPRIFRHAMDVPPLRMKPSSYLFSAVPLMPTSQNLTTSVYLVGGLLLALSACVVCFDRRASVAVVRTGVAIAWTHVLLGLAGIAGAAEILRVFRNASYAQLDNEFRGFVRITGIFPEASGYAAYALVWFAFMVECWYRGVRPRQTGAAALALLAVLVFSTSSSAYVGLAIYGALFALRLLLLPRAVDGRRVAAILALALAGTILVLCIAVLVPAFADAFGTMLARMTVEKSNSDSGLQRAFWARKGLEAVRVSYGLGIGPGSFRSSSLFAAILGSTGVIGIATFLAYLARVIRPLRRSTYDIAVDERTAVGAAASWALVMLLIPLGIAGPSADPGGDFAIFAGIALGLRAASVTWTGERGLPQEGPVDHGQIEGSYVHGR
jgi:hypothetical protein